VVRTIGLIDQLQLTCTGLEPDRAYDLVLADDPMPPHGSFQALASFRSEADGRASSQALGPVRKAVIGKPDVVGDDAGRRRVLLVLPRGGTRSRPVLVETRR
jgi:hypothetical protein